MKRTTWYNRNNYFNYKTFGILVTIVVAGALIGIMMKDGESDEIFDTYYEVYPSVINNFNWVSDSEKDKVVRFFNSYESKNYKEAIIIYKEIDENFSNLYLEFYLAQCYYALGNFNKAKPILENIKNNKKGFYSESLWYLVLIEIKQGNNEESKSLLKLIIDSSNFKVQQSKNILNTID